MLQSQWTEEPQEQAGTASRQWYALYTRSHCEQLVYDQLTMRGFRLFLPQIDVWSRRSGRQRLVRVPMLPGYLFLHHIIDKVSYIAVSQARGLVRILGERWDRLAVVSAEEITTLQRIACAPLPARHYPYLRAGQRVRIIDGPLVGMKGIFVHSKAHKGLVVLSIEMVQRSVAVEVESTLVVPVYEL